MTQWYAPRQLEGGPNKGKWHYTCSNTSGKSIYPVGACSIDCPGHDSAHEATKHYAQGLAEGEIRERDDPGEQRKCIECGAWTQHRAVLWGEHFMDEIAICRTHDSRPHIRKAVFDLYRIEIS